MAREDDEDTQTYRVVRSEERRACSILPGAYLPQAANGRRG